MQVRRLTIDNFRGIRHTELYLPEHTVLIGDNNVGKTTVLEALDLVLGPERLNRFPVVDEHDFFRGQYMEASDEDAQVDEQEDANDNDVADEEHEGDEAALDENDDHGEEDGRDLAKLPGQQIEIEAVIIGLSDEQKARFGGHAEWWDENTDQIYEKPNPEGVDAEHIVQALRVTFIGRYDADDDDFEGNTYFTRSLSEDDNPSKFGRRDKQVCGFLYLRSRRTGTRALSLERGSLLDIILRLKEIRPQMWEDTLSELSLYSVASDEAHGISGVLESISKALAKYVPKDWGRQPHLRVSNLTRDHLRKVITAFIATGEGDHAAPFYRQGAGTINMLVLAMLSLIAEDKQNVIFGMEEPETAIPPYAQKRIVQEVRNLASQAIFTSHSPYVVEEFALSDTIVLSRDSDGNMLQTDVALPASVKLKRYRQEFRTRFCEGLLASRVLVAEGATEATSLPAAARRLAELNPEKYASLEALGVCTVDAGGDGNIADISAMYVTLGKRVFAACDKQSAEDQERIENEVEELFMHDESSMENLVLKESALEAFERFSDVVDWPIHITNAVDVENEPINAFRKYFSWSKGNWGIAEFLAQCDEDEMPEWVRGTCASLKQLCEDSSAEADEAHEGGACVEESSGNDDED